MYTDTQILTESHIKTMIDGAIEAAKKDKYLPTKAQMCNELTKLPDQIQRQFEKDIVKYALKWDDRVFSYKKKENGKEVVCKGELFDIIDLVKQDAPTEEDRKLAFYAFCVAENHARRNENLSILTDLTENYRGYFADQPFLLHLEVCETIKKLDSYIKEDWENKDFGEYLQKARTNMEQLSENIGAAHAYAELILLAFENDPALLDFLGDKKKEKLLQSALDIMVVVHSKDDYAKFYSTHGRLFAVAGKYEDALNFLKKAIDKEDSSKSDYPIRVGRYLAYIQQIRTQQQTEANKRIADEQLKNTVKTIEDQTKDSTTKSMEFLGLFSGIVSFTIGSLTIGGAIAEQSIKHAAGLIIVLMGALMGVFAAFGVILHGFETKKTLRNLIVLLMGLGIIAGGMWLCLR